MTENLFYKDAYIKEFEAKVLSCEKDKNLYKIILDKTAFSLKVEDRPLIQAL